MKKTSKHNQLLKDVAKANDLSFTTIKKIDELSRENPSEITSLMDKAKANSAKRTYSQDLIIPNNAMLLQLLKHNWHRYAEDLNYSTYIYTKDIELKKDWYREKLRVVSSKFGQDAKYLFSGLTIEDFYIISGIFTLIQKTPIVTKHECGECFKIPTKHLYKVLNPSGRWDMTSTTNKKEFVGKVGKTLAKCQRIEADYWLNHKLVINSIDTQDVNYINSQADNAPTEDSVGLIFKRAYISPEKDGFLVQLNKNGLLNQSVKQNRLVTLKKDLLQFGRNTSNHDIIKFYIAYRVELAANTHNKMRAEINIKHMDYEVGKTDKAFVKKYLQYLQDIRIIKDYSVSRVKITWTMQQDTKDIELIQVRDNDKEQIELPQTAEIADLEKRLSAVNDFNARHKITLGKFQILNTRLHAVFSRGSFDKGGRLYTDGDNGYQGLKSEDREKILIDGKKTVELDYSAFHAHLLYAFRGLQTNADPYSFYPNRKAAKLAFNIMLNAKDRTEAAGAFKRAWSEHGQGALDISADSLFRLCAETHKPIADSFCNDSGLKLQNQDSKIALSVVEAMQKLKTACLPMHDSFIVAADKAEELKRTMQKIYYQYTGFDCPIK